MAIAAEDFNWETIPQSDREALTRLAQLALTCSCHPDFCPVELAVFFPDDDLPLALCGSCYKDRQSEFVHLRVWPIPSY